MSEPIKILMVEDVATEAELATRELRRDGLAVDTQRVETRDDFLAMLGSFTPHLILSDFSLPKFDGFTALDIAHQNYPDIPFIFLSGTIGEQTAIDALKAGACDYVLKTNLLRLAPAVRRALEDVQMRTARRQAESRFRDLIEFAPDAMVVIDAQGVIEMVNAEAEFLFGYGRDEIVGRPSDVLIPQRFRQWHDRMDGKAIIPADSHRLASSFEVAGTRKDGIEFPIEVSLRPLHTDTGICMSSVIRDIAERKAQEDRLARLSRIHTVIGEINSAIVHIHDKQQFLDEACRVAVENGQFAAAWVGMFDPATLIVKPLAWSGITEESLHQFQISTDERFPAGQGAVGIAIRTKHSVVSNDVRNDQRLVSQHEMYNAVGYQSVFVVPLMAGDTVLGILCLFDTKTNVFNEGEQHLLREVGGDISYALDHFNKGEQINRLTHFDPLTGLANRTLFNARFGQLIEQQMTLHGQIALVLIDLDRFRNVNDSFGRSTGDALLREVAARIQECVPNPTYVSRIAADCFAFAFPIKDRVDGALIKTIVETRLGARLAMPVQLQDIEIRISVRAGIAFYPADGMDVDTLLRNADAALNSAKLSKTPYRFYTASMNEHGAEALSVENRLRRALDEEQFILHYQPKIDLVSGKIVGLEALIRWNEPGVGLVPPIEFIHILEETGLIVQVGNWVIARAHRQYAEWVARGIAPPRIAVNVSQVQLRQKDFVSHVLQMLKSAAAGEIEIEITESLFMEDIDLNIAKLVALRATGITIAVDDFGTGYSSLSNIARLPIDVLKIDGSFIRDMTTSDAHMAIVSTIISLAHWLDLKVVAEGVETTEQSDLLKRLGCDQIQGYLYSKPLRPEEVELLLNHHETAEDRYRHV